MLRAFRRLIPHKVKKAARLIYSLLMNELIYLELHLTDHCNLNCKGCFHFSPIAPAHYTDSDQYINDLTRLSQLFRTIRTIRLMGGEPLLHPNADQFIYTTRNAFPKSRIQLVTNGILLPKATQAFWQACRDTGTTIDLILYPPSRKKLDAFQDLCNRESVALRTCQVDFFKAYCNFKGDSPKHDTFTRCDIGFNCIYLQAGRLYTCAMSTLIQHFNKKFDLRFPTDKGIDIHSSGTTGRNSLMKLSKPVETCKWCSDKPTSFAWQHSRHMLKDWDTHN